MHNKKENRALLNGGVANIFMAAIAWLTFYYSNSEAILLDGNYSLVMFLGVLLMSVATAVFRIVMYFTGSSEDIPMLIPEPILDYALTCAVICYSASFFYYQQNRSIGNMSILLKTEQKATFVDGTLSLGIGLEVGSFPTWRILSSF